MARKPKWNDIDKAALKRLVDRYGAAAVVSEARKIKPAASNDYPTTEDVTAMAAGLLLDHAQALADGLSDPRWIGEAELKRRAAVLVIRTASFTNMPEPLMWLLKRLLYPNGDPYAGKNERLSLAWTRAAMKESEYPPAGPGKYFTADVSAVARAAFPDGGDHRKTIKDWRKEPAYLDFVTMNRLALNVAKERAAGTLDESFIDRLQDNDFVSWFDQMITGLRRTADHPWGEK